ncbi:hypothetical protein JCM33374_g701 [Metschnikowia sp. JCM 33374]|nr:hypothetical protein JCM33374_g701 [Metschnikowia sp. JCM 33374]
MWWTLPTELVDQILELISFDEYVSLTQISTEVRHILDNQDRFLVVLNANFGLDLDAYDWELSPSVTRVSLFAALNELRHFIRSVDCVYPTNQTNDQTSLHEKRNETVIHALRTFATNPIYFLPLLLEFRAAQLALRQNANKALSLKHGLDSPITFSIARISWLRKLLQLQNFLHAANFFMNADPEDTSSIEKCYFELSRCYIEFSDLTKYRMMMLKDIRTNVRVFLDTASGNSFPNKPAYRAFLADILRIILSTLNPAQASPGCGGNILRVYKGVGRESASIYMSIVAKIFQEEIYGRFVFDIGGEKRRNPPVLVAPLFLILDDIYVSINFSTNSWNFYEPENLTRLPTATLRDAIMPATTQSVLMRTFDSDESEISSPSDLLNQDWSNMHFNTSMIKLRFLRTILTSLCENKSLSSTRFRPLVHRSDFFLYFYSTMSLLEGPETEIPSFQEHTSYLSESQHKTPKFNTGDLIVNQPSDYFGVVLGNSPRRLDGGMLVSTLPFDNIEKSVALHTSVKHVCLEDLGQSFPNFLLWLMSTDGMAYAGMFLFPELRVSAEKLSLGHFYE